MTAKIRSTFKSDAATALADNTTGAITPAVLRAQIDHLADSAVFPGDAAITATTINAQTGTAYTLALTDRGALVTMDNAAANTVTIPTNASVAFGIGEVISVVQLGAGVTKVKGATGVTVNGVAAGGADIQTRYRGGATLTKLTADTWLLSGDVAAVA